MKPFWIFTAILVAAYGIHLGSSLRPHVSAAKHDALYIHARSPNDIAVKLYVVWQTTAHGWGCEKYMPLVGSYPREIKIPVDPVRTPRVSHQWMVWRDAFEPGRCGWMMKSVDVYADNARSYLKIDRETNISNRIAYVLHRPNSMTVILGPKTTMVKSRFVCFVISQNFTSWIDAEHKML